VCKTASKPVKGAQRHVKTRGCLLFGATGLNGFVGKQGVDHPFPRKIIKHVRFGGPNLQTHPNGQKSLKLR
jgi:hypothetical protein